MALEIKAGVRLMGLMPEMCVALIAIERLFVNIGHTCVITSGIEGKHAADSKHYVGAALDFRTRELDSFTAQRLAKDAQRALGDDYWVQLEADHMHVQYRPAKHNATS
jgi:hypothetical protein